MIINEKQLEETPHTIYRIYSIYDILAEEGSAPFLAKNDEVAKRIFNNTLKHHNINEHELYHIGFYNQTLQTGSFNDKNYPIIIKGSATNE